MEENEFWKMMDRISDILQIANYEMLLKDATNNQIMNYLQHQDVDLLSTIISQNEIIIAQNEELLNLLKKGEENDNRRNL